MQNEMIQNLERRTDMNSDFDPVIRENRRFRKGTSLDFILKNQKREHIYYFLKEIIDMLFFNIDIFETSVQI